jgi:ABC-type tungstate transport system substrate-binding protein
VRGSFAIHFEDYPLRFSIILDLATIITITNDKTRLINYRLALIGDEVWFGNKTLSILGYGTIILKMGNQTMLLKDIVYYLRLLTTLVALRKLRKKGIY